MKRTAIIIGLVTCTFLNPSLSKAIETTKGITDREIVERLTKVETKLDSLEKGMEQLREDMNARFNRLVAIFTALVVAVIGFAIWDRRTIIRPFETKVKEIEEEIAKNRSRLHSLLESLRALSKTDSRVAEVLRSFNLL